MLARVRPRAVRQVPSTATSIPAPVGGWNARDALSDMPITDAVTLQNIFPSTTYCALRNGYSVQSSAITGWVETLMQYSGGATTKLFGAAGTVIYDCTTTGAASPSLTGLTNARWQYVNNTTAGGSYIQCVNGADKMRYFDGSAWHADGDGGAYDVTGVDTATCIGITLSHNRVWLTKVGVLKAYYLATGAIGGVATAFDISSFCLRGGYIMTIDTWTMDAGYGMDDMTVFITSNGEVLVYRGTDPASASTWGLIGRYWIGSPIGRRCCVKYAGDLLIITQDGVQPLSLALQSSRLNPRVSITDKIQFAVSAAVSNFGSVYGWQLMPFPKENMLFLNVPLQNQAIYQQYVMNTITRSWCNFTGWNAVCWELFNDNVYFGGNGYVGRAWNTAADNGGIISFDGFQAFSYFGQPNREKLFVNMRPVLNTNGSPMLSTKMNLDFDLSAPTAAAAYSTSASGVWDTGLWNSATWAPDTAIQANWQGANGVGRAAAPHIAGNCFGITVQWMSTDVLWRPGGIFG